MARYISCIKHLKKKMEIKLFKILVNWIYSKCDLILAQSENMLNEINLYPGVRNNTCYFPSWGDSDLFKETTEPAPEIKFKIYLQYYLLAILEKLKTFQI